MRAPLAPLLILSLMAAAGCTLLDELDAGRNGMPQAARNAAAPTTHLADQGSPLLEASRQWWREARSLGPTELDPDTVRCRFLKSTRYMSKNDCLSRGGTPGRASG